MRERDFFRQRLTEEELRDLLRGADPAGAFAWRSPRAKAMNLDPKNPPSDDELVKMMLEVPYLVRRPIIRLGREVIFGFDAERVERALLSSAG